MRQISNLLIKHFQVVYTNVVHMLLANLFSTFGILKYRYQHLAKNKIKKLKL